MAKAPAQTVGDEEGYGVHPVDEIIVEEGFLLGAVQKGNPGPEDDQLDPPAFGEVGNDDGVVHHVVGGETVQVSARAGPVLGGVGDGQNVELLDPCNGSFRGGPREQAGGPALAGVGVEVEMVATDDPGVLKADTRPALEVQARGDL